jgi:hypothetical protein
LLETIAMWLQLQKKETFKVCKLKKLLSYLREFIRGKLWDLGWWEACFCS